MGKLEVNLKTDGHKMGAYTREYQFLSVQQFATILLYHAILDFPLGTSQKQVSSEGFLLSCPADQHLTSPAIYANQWR